MVDSIPVAHKTKIETQEAMMQCALFSHLPRRDFDALLDKAQVIEIAEKALLMMQGQAATNFFLVVQGELKLAFTSPMGQEKILHILRQGDTFAEALMFLEKPVYPASVTAISASTVLAFSAELYQSVLKQSLEACFGILGEYSQRIRNLVSEIESLATHNATIRVVHYLLRDAPEKQSGSSLVQLNTPKHAIASRLSITPETLSRILSKLGRKGVIEVSENRVILCDIERMRQLVEEA